MSKPGEYWRNDRKTIQCCFGCTPPRRYPGCGSHCEEYKAEKAALAEQQAAYKRSLPDRAINQYDFDRVRSCASRKRK